MAAAVAHMHMSKVLVAKKERLSLGKRMSSDMLCMWRVWAVAAAASERIRRADALKVLEL